MADYLYVCQFSNGHVKVGRSATPKARIAQHELRVACMGVELTQSFVVEGVGDVTACEAYLIDQCAAKAERRFNNEWFVGLDFDQACELAKDAAAYQEAKPTGPLSALYRQLDATARADLARRAGISKVYLWQLQKGVRHNPGLAVILRLSKADPRLDPADLVAEFSGPSA